MFYLLEAKERPLNVFQYCKIEWVVLLWLFILSGTLSENLTGSVWSCYWKFEFSSSLFEKAPASISISLFFCKFSSSSPCCCCCWSFHPSYYIWADSIDCLTLITLQVYYLLWMPSRIYEPNVFVMVWWSAHSAAFWDDLGLIPTKAWMYKIPSFCFFWFTGLAKQFGREICNHQ